MKQLLRGGLCALAVVCAHSALATSWTVSTANNRCVVESVQGEHTVRFVHGEFFTEDSWFAVSNPNWQFEDGGTVWENVIVISANGEQRQMRVAFQQTYGGNELVASGAQLGLHQIGLVNTMVRPDQALVRYVIDLPGPNDIAVDLTGLPMVRYQKGIGCS